jgi:hypothetical protein
MRAAYYGGSLTGSGQSLGLLEYYGTDLADLNTYYSKMGIYLTPVAPTSCGFRNPGLRNT